MPRMPHTLVDPSALDARATLVRTPCGDGTMVWRLWGNGFPLVLLHGASGAWTHWVRNIPALAERCRVIAADMPGFGDSDAPSGPHTADTLADIVSAGLDVVIPPPARFDIAGFSFGGIIGGLVGARQHERMRRLIVIGSGGLGTGVAELPELIRVTPGMSSAEARDAHRENLRRLMLGDPGRADDLAVDLHAGNLRRARFKPGSIPASDVLARALPRIRARVSAVWGERDVFAGPYLDERRAVIERVHRDAEFHIVKGAGHWVAYEAPDDVNRIILDDGDSRPSL
jgi:pimeloyl-ACP methyl ester carboxylesterase